jgi:hypothetical protein
LYSPLLLLAIQWLGSQACPIPAVSKPKASTCLDCWSRQVLH